MFVVTFTDITSAQAWIVYSKCKHLGIGYYSEYTHNYNQNAVCGPMTAGDKDALVKLINDKTRTTVLKEV
uniref:Uncharacterized protein n=1 Tax=Podoviridae sp. ctoyw14 TaxID=2826578 RepID=A0A8S5LVH4_9CAUD|nr:MAG TPA: hypothetical protein [Podoviridae sp. ctoyw14]